jgi:glycosyltransferase involved in cell wall biosynthesis
MNALRGLTDVKVLFIIQAHDMPSSRVRVLNLLPELLKKGIHAETCVYPKRLRYKIELFRRLGDFDIVYLQKKLPTPLEGALLKRFSRKLFFDFDDAIYLRHDADGELESSSRQNRFRNITKRVDFVVAGNRFLADYAREFNENITVIPSSVETRNIPQKDYSRTHEKIIIGWVGGGINLHHVRLLSPVFRRLSKEHPIEIRVLSSDGIEVPGVPVRSIPWSLETQEKEIAEFDIGVMPLPDNMHTRGKCAYKAIQYMAGGVPSVCSDVGINREAIGDGGIAVKSTEEFYLALKKLIENRCLRESMGRNGRAKAEREFSVEKIGPRLADILLGRESGQ